MWHRVCHRLLGDGIEYDTLHRLRLDRLFLLEHFQHVPGDRLALAVRVRGEDQLVGALYGAGDVVQPLGSLVIDLPNHAEIVVRIDRAIFRGEVADMTKRGQDLIARAQIFVDRLSLGRRFDNDNFH
jgi:hypothetical protein